MTAKALTKAPITQKKAEKASTKGKAKCSNPQVPNMYVALSLNLLIMHTLTYKEHHMLYHLGDYSPHTTSLQYGYGLNPTWGSSLQHPCPPTSAHSEPVVKSLKPPANAMKPTSSSIVRPSDLDDRMILDDNEPALLKLKNTSHQKSHAPRKEPSVTSVADFEPEQALDDKSLAPANSGTHECTDDDMDFDTNTECQLALSSAVKQEVNAEVNDCILQRSRC